MDLLWFCFNVHRCFQYYCALTQFNKTLDKTACFYCQILDMGSLESFCFSVWSSWFNSSWDLPVWSFHVLPVPVWAYSNLVYSTVQTYAAGCLCGPVISWQLSRVYHSPSNSSWDKLQHRWPLRDQEEENETKNFVFSIKYSPVLTRCCALRGSFLN